MPIIAIDFDGIIVRDEFPNIGKPYPGAIEAINELYNSGYCIIINSCRAREHEREMIHWLERNDVLFSHCNENCRILIRRYSTDCRKISADIYIDDKSLFAPNMENPNQWDIIRNMIMLKYGTNHERMCGEI